MGKKGRKNKQNGHSEDGEARMFRTRGKKKAQNKKQRNWNKRIGEEIRDGMIKEEDLDFFEN